MTTAVRTIDAPEHGVAMIERARKLAQERHDTSISQARRAEIARALEELIERRDLVEAVQAGRERMATAKEVADHLEAMLRRFGAGSARVDSDFVKAMAEDVYAAQPGIEALAEGCRVVRTTLKRFPYVADVLDAIGDAAFRVRSGRRIIEDAAQIRKAMGPVEPAG